jgi:hypothetical protein
MVPVRTAGNAVDRDPLLVLDVAEGQARLVVVGLEVAPAVALDPVQAEIVGLGQVDGAALGQPALPERVEGQRDQAVRQSRKPLTNPSTPSRPRGILGDGAAERDLTRNGDGLKEPRCTSGSSAARVASSPAGSTLAGTRSKASGYSARTTSTFCRDSVPLSAHMPGERSAARCLDMLRAPRRVAADARASLSESSTVRTHHVGASEVRPLERAYAAQWRIRCHPPRKRKRGGSRGAAKRRSGSPGGRAATKVHGGLLSGRLRGLASRAPLGQATLGFLTGAFAI